VNLFVSDLLILAGILVHQIY